MDCFSSARVHGFLHTDGRIMRNGNGDEVILRGWAAGNWTNPEGFLCGDAARPWSADDEFAVPGRFDRARSIEDSVRLLCGSQYAKSFWPRWYRAHLGEADIKAMAEYGYNSIRLPLNARAFLPEEPGFFWNEDSFSMLDEVLSWCEKYKLYAILDLHTTPGGQSGIKCDDGLEFMPRFFMEEESMERAICLWEEFARRYKDCWIVGGYDLLNEPLAAPKWLKLLPQLRSFYDRLICRIRAIDTNHMLTLEGGAAATNTEIFNRDYDPVCHNWCIHAHYYRLSPQIRSLYLYLEPSMRLNVPLWLGEGGGPMVEIGVFLQAAQALHIGYSLWSWKVASLPNGQLRRDPVQYSLPKGWYHVISSLTSGEPRPSYQECQDIFDEMLQNMLFENCFLSEDQHAYALARPGRTVPAAGYDASLVMGASFSGQWPYGNPYDFRTEDRMHLVLKDGCIPPRRDMPFAQSANFVSKPLDCLLLQLDTGDFACYSVWNVKASCKVCLRLHAEQDSVLLVQCKNEVVHLSVPASLGFRVHHALTLTGCEQATVRLETLSGCIQLEAVQFLA